jgi:hypothetical protein
MLTEPSVASEPTPPRIAAPVPPAPPPPAPPAVERIPEPRIEEEPVINGPSFLGLNQPAPQSSSSERRRGSLSIDPSSAPRSRNLDYLLDDDELKHGGGWKAVVIFLALALAVGLGYLRWKNQGFGWLGGEKHPATQTAEDSNTQPAAPSTPAGQPPVAGAGPGNAGAPANSAANPGDAAATNPAPAAASPGASPAAGNAPDSTGAAAPQPAPSPNSVAPSTTAPSSAPSSATAAPTDSSDAKPVPPTPSPAASAAGKDAAVDDSSAPAARAKPSAASAASVRPVDPVAEAQKYLYGKGAPQNCDRGLRLLKPAAEHANSKAMIEMGALYSAGLCTPRDLPTAYRWFAMALRKEPDNASVQTDLQKLWGEMTQPERQLAIKLSQ